VDADTDSDTDERDRAGEGKSEGDDEGAEDDPWTGVAEAGEGEEKGQYAQAGPPGRTAAPSTISSPAPRRAPPGHGVTSATPSRCPASAAALVPRHNAHITDPVRHFRTARWTEWSTYS
jgi:hypothetical protein